MNILHPDRSVCVVGFYPCPETTSNNRGLTESHYRALYLTYGVSIRLVETPEEIKFSTKITYVAVEQENKSSIPMREFVHPDKAAYVVGNSTYQFPSFWCDVSYRVHIDVPHMAKPLYGDQAAVIILNDRYMKNESKLQQL